MSRLDLVATTFVLAVLLERGDQADLDDSEPSPCLPLCCGDGDGLPTAHWMGLCAAVEMVDGARLEDSDACSKLPDLTFKKTSNDSASEKLIGNWTVVSPRCASGEPPRKVRLAPNAHLRGRKISRRLIEVQLSLPRGFISSFYNVLRPDSSPPPPFPVPTSFCPTALDHRGRVNEALVCPRVKLKSTRLTKCCPFGQELRFPAWPNGGRCQAVTGLRPQGSHNGDVDGDGDGGEEQSGALSRLRRASRWYLRMNGYRVGLQNLVRFPFVDVLHEPRRNPWSCPPNSTMAADYEAFQFDLDGRLLFTRLIGDSLSVDDFCVDSMVVLSGLRGGHASPGLRAGAGRFRMTLLFCIPDALLAADGGRLNKTLTAAADSLRKDVWRLRASAAADLQSRLQTVSALIIGIMCRRPTVA